MQERYEKIKKKTERVDKMITTMVRNNDLHTPQQVQNEELSLVVSILQDISESLAYLCVKEDERNEMLKKGNENVEDYKAGFDYLADALSSNKL